MSILDQLRTYGGSWNVVSKEKMATEDVARIEEAKVVANEYGLSMCFMLKSGERKYMPVSRDAKLEEGDSIKLDTIEVLTLEREGNNPIIRAIGEAL